MHPLPALSCQLVLKISDGGGKLRIGAVLNALLAELHLTVTGSAQLVQRLQSHL